MHTPPEKRRSSEFELTKKDAITDNPKRQPPKEDWT